MIATNLAIIIARAGKQTLLIDADMHRPTQHKLFNLSSDGMGLSNALLAFSLSGSSTTTASTDPHFENPAQAPNGVPAGSVSLRPFVHAVGIPNLWIMPSGPLPPNPSEFLDSKAMQRFLVALVLLLVPPELVFARPVRARLGLGLGLRLRLRLRLGLGLGRLFGFGHVGLLLCHLRDSTHCSCPFRVRRFLGVAVAGGVCASMASPGHGCPGEPVSLLTSHE